MKKINKYLILFFALWQINYSYSQKLNNNSEEILDFVDVEASPPEGYEKFFHYIVKNIKYPKNFKGGEFKVELIVEKDGLVHVKSITPNNNKEINREIIKVIEMCPNWSPSYVDNKKVRSRFILPINFQN